MSYDRGQLSRSGRCNKNNIDSNSEARRLLEEGDVTLPMYIESNEKRNRLTSYALLVSIALACFVFLAIGFTIIRVNQGVSDIQASLAPHTAEFVNMTRGMMLSTSDTLTHLNHAASHGDDLMANPVLTMSLGGSRVPHS